MSMGSYQILQTLLRTEKGARQAVQNQYLFGKSFLVAPFDSTKDFGKVWFPAGKWYELYSDAVQDGAREQVIELSVSRLPVYVKESSIVPVQSLVQSTSEKPSDTLAIHIYKGDVNNSTKYYEDDGASFSYQKGDFYSRDITYDAAARRISFGAVDGGFKSKFSKLEIVLHGFGDAPSLQLNQKAVALKAGTSDLFDGAAGKVRVSSTIINNERGSFVLSY